MLFLVAYSWQVIANPAGALAIGLDGIVNAIWLVFVADYIINVVLAEHRWRWVRTHLLNLATVALPFLRPLRLLRLLTVLRVLQRHAGTVLRGNLLAYVGAASLLQASRTRDPPMPPIALMDRGPAEVLRSCL